MPNSVWASDRLVYRAAEPEDQAFLIEGRQIAASFVNVAPILPVPQGSAGAARSMQKLNEALLGVIICLSEDEAVATGAAIKPETGSSSKKKLTPIGSLRLEPIEAKAVHHRETDIGIGLLPKYQGRGYGSEAILWAVEWAFLYANVHRMGIHCFEYNTGALRLYQRLGFVVEGRKREGLWYKGRYWDEIHLSMLDREWHARYGKEIDLP
ncbi:hypothetical protein ANO11243_016800 [Dothideomycetidae sp. 11243]|nr:hypothetical protein ANO11243_016800 [fungal sp. No.11243]